MNKQHNRMDIGYQLISFILIIHLCIYQSNQWKLYIQLYINYNSIIYILDVHGTNKIFDYSKLNI